ncbi:MAG: sulfatase-like hydrolase/transferase [Candidatus Staskawiczbacteria bacterium]
MSDFLNIIAVFLVIISLVNIGIYELKKSATWQKSKSIGVNKSATIDLEKTDELRDIYYIILDGYANSGILKEVYGYDNHEFIDYLTEKGFYIAPESRSNYGSTFLSLASSLNMEYINYLADIVGTSSTDRSIPYQMIEFNKVADFLKSRGYKFVHFGSSWGPTQNNSLANLSFDFSIENEFRMQLIQMTVLRVFESRFGFIKADARNQILRTFSKLAEVHKINEPIFVFAHIISPHPPYLFGANGEPVPETSLEMDGDIWEEKNKYLDQLAFINKKVKILVEKILSSSEIPPIIILQADHGSASLFSSSDGGGWDDPTEEMINERMKIFNAYYLPNGGGDTLYNSITPVNTFRLIFDFYFRADSYELFGDQSYYSTYGRPYNFIDISGKIH